MVGVFFYAQNAAGEIAFVGAERCTRGFLRSTRSSKCRIASSASHSPSSRTSTLPDAARSLSARSSAAQSFTGEFNCTPP